MEGIWLKESPLVAAQKIPTKLQLKRLPWMI